MSTQTTNLKLTKPDKEDFYDVSVFNKNMDKIDEGISNILEVVEITIDDTVTLENFIQMLQEQCITKSKITLFIHASSNSTIFGEKGNFGMNVIGNTGNYVFYAINHWNGKVFTGSFNTYSNNFSLNMLVSNQVS